MRGNSSVCPLVWREKDFANSTAARRVGTSTVQSVSGLSVSEMGKRDKMFSARMSRKASPAAMERTRGMESVMV